MEIKRKSDMAFYLNEIANEKNGYVYMLTPFKTLVINGDYDMGGFLVYQNGCWYGRKGKNLM